MNKGEREKINRFLNDVGMSDAVHTTLIKSFLKTRGDRDVHLLAAAKIAIELLDEAWKDMSRMKDEETLPSSVRQVGL